MDIFKSSSKIFVAKLGSACLSFLGIAYFARELGATALGTYFLFQALIGLCSIFADFGLRDAIEKRISEELQSSDILLTGIILKSALLALISIPPLLFDELINQYIGAEVAGLLVIALVAQEGADLMMKVVQAELRVGDTAILRLSRIVVWVLGGVLLINLGVGLKSLIFSLILSNIVVLIWGNYRRSVVLGDFRFSLVSNLFDFSKYSFILSSGGYIYGWMDILIIGLFLSQSHVGAYEAAWRITTILGLVSLSIETSIFPQISRWDVADQTEKIESLLPMAIIPGLLITIPAVFGLILYSNQILSLLFGQEFVLAGLALIILSIEKIFQSIQRVLGRSLQGVNRPDLAAKSTTLAVILNVSLNFILVPEWGITGAAIATAVSFSIDALIQGVLLSYLLTIDIPLREVIWCIISSVGMFAILSIVNDYIAVDSLVHLFLVVFVGILFYCCCLFMSPTIRDRICRLPDI